MAARRGSNDAGARASRNGEKRDGAKPAGAKRDGAKREAGKRDGAKREAGKRDGGKRDGAKETVKRVGGARNEFGTRVARRIDCSRCGRSDHIAYVPKDRAKALCRDCAVEVLRMYEVGVKARVSTRVVPCNLCGTPFDLPANVEDDGDLLCRSCLRGFTAWQGSVDVPFDERSRAHAEPRRSGTLIRRRKDDAGG